jgi:hypothetical protein
VRATTSARSRSKKATRAKRTRVSARRRQVKARKQ